MSKHLTSVAALAGIFAFAIASTASAAPFYEGKKTIRNDRGGYVIRYALQMKKLERSRQPVRFAGRCDSACTLYLGLPSSQVCATPGSAFGFHLPYGGSSDANKMMRDYMLKSYPSWVRSWINRNGGLTSTIKVMRYEHVSKYLPTCKTSARPQLVGLSTR